MVAILLNLVIGQSLAIQPQRDIPYVQNASELQTLDVWKPANNPKATVVFVYGGGWHSPRGKGVDEVAKAFVNEGYACVLIRHRLGPADKFPAQIEDLASAVQYLKSHRDLGLPDRKILVGHSSGAHLCLLLVSDPRYLAKHGIDSSDFSAVVGLSTPTDLRPKQNNTFADALMAGRGADTFGRDVKLMADASPITHSGRKLPKTLLIAGDKDMPGLYQDALAFKNLNSSVQVQLAENCDHMGTIGGIVDLTSPIHKVVFQFLEEAIKSK